MNLTSELFKADATSLFSRFDAFVSNTDPTPGGWGSGWRLRGATACARTQLYPATPQGNIPICTVQPGG